MRKKEGGPKVDKALKFIDKADTFTSRVKTSTLGEGYEACRQALINTGGMHIGIAPKDMMDLRKLMENIGPYLANKYKKKP